MPTWRAGVDEDEIDGGDSPLEADARATAYALALSRQLHPGNLPGPTAVQEVFTEEDVQRLRMKSRQSILSIQEEFASHPSEGGLFEKGQLLTQEEYIQGRLMAGMAPMDFGGRAARSQPLAPPTGSRDMIPAFGMGSLAGRVVVSRGSADMLTVVSRGSRDFQEALSHGSRDNQEASNRIVEEDIGQYPTIPRQPTTFVDSLSTISLLNQPRPLTMGDVDSVIARVTRKDPFARATLGKAPPTILLPATANEVQRVLNHELGVDLTFEGYDFARPSDIFERFHQSPKAPALDAPRQKLVDFLVGWGTAVSVSNKLAPSGNLDLESPGGMTWINRSARDPSTGISQMGDRLRGAVGGVLSPYILDLANPTMDYLFPQGRGKAAPDHPVQAYLHDAGGFLLNFLLPGMNVRDALGVRWVPGAAGSSTYETMNRLRAEFGAPLMAALMGDDGAMRSVSVDPQPHPFGYTRGWFGMNPGGKDLDRWDALKGAFESSQIHDPVLGPRSTLNQLQFWGGSWNDPYRGDSTFVVTNEFKFQGIGTKNGKPVFRAQHVSPFQLDHVLPLSYAWQHGYDQLAGELASLLADVPVDPAKRVRSVPATRDLGGTGFLVSQAILQQVDLSDTSAAHDRARKILELLARVGNANSLDQFALVSSALNQAKGDKGPGGFLPYDWASNAVQHKSNLEYIGRWRRLVAQNRKDARDLLGEDLPDLLALDRRDELAMRRVELGIDTWPRLLRPAGQAYVEFIDSPNLSDPTLYQQLQTTRLLGTAAFAVGLSTWPLKPWNRVYLALREHFLRGFWDHAFPKGAAFDFRAASVGSRASSWVNWYRDRWAGIPLVGRSASASDDALLALQDLVRSGKTVASVDRWGEVTETGLGGRVATGTPGQFWRYYRGAEDPFGAQLSIREFGDESRTLLYSKQGVQTLRAEPLLLEVVHALRERQPATAAGKLVRDLLVKAADYGGRGLFGIGGGLGNMNPARLVPILAVESMANLSGRFTGATSSVPLHFTGWQYKGGLFRWLEQEQAARAQAVADARDALNRATEDEHLVALRSSLASAEQNQSSFQGLLREEGAWLTEARDMPGLRGRFTRLAMEHPRVTAGAARVLARTPAHLATIVKSPFVFHANVAAAIEDSKILRRGFGALNAAGQALGYVEGISRFSRARELSRRPYSSLSRQERGELDDYVDLGSPLKVLGTMFLDAGGPASIPATPVQWAKAAPGYLLAVGNKAASLAVLAKAREDSSYRNDELRRLVQRLPTPSEIARVDRENTIARNRGFLTAQMRAASPFASARLDTSEVFDAMRRHHELLGDPDSTFAKRMAQARSKLNLGKAVDSLGYEVTTTRFGKEIRRPFQMAPQSRSDVSLVAAGGRFDTAVVVKPAAAMDADRRASRLHAEALELRRRQRMDELGRRVQQDGIFSTLRWMFAQPDIRSSTVAQDSLDVLRNLQQGAARRDIVRASSRPR